MAVSIFWYGLAQAALANKEIDWTSDAIKVALCTSTYTPAQDTHDYFNDITNEITGVGYTAGGATLANCTSGYTAGTNVQKLDADDAAWVTATITARYAIIYDAQTGVAATSPLIAYVDFGTDVVSTGATFTITWAAAGILTMTAA